MMHMLHFILHEPASTKQLQHRCITYNYNTRSTSKCAAHGYSAQVHWGAVAVVQAYGATSRNTSQLLAAAPAPSSQLTVLHVATVPQLAVATIAVTH
jgi:hypothetical protein